MFSNICLNLFHNILFQLETPPLVASISYNFGDGIKMQELDLSNRKSKTSLHRVLVDKTNLPQLNKCKNKLPCFCANKRDEAVHFSEALQHLKTGSLDDDNIVSIQKAISYKIARLRNQAYNAKKRQAKSSTAIVGRKRSSDVDKAISDAAEFNILLEDSYRKGFNAFDHKENLAFILNDCIKCIEKYNSRKLKKINI